MKSRNLIIGCIIILIVGCIGAAVVGFVFLKVGGGVVTSIAEGPYKVGARPTPPSDDTDTLFPKTVGPYKRGDITNVQDGEANAPYTSSDSKLKLTVEVYKTTTAAADRVGAIKQDIDPATPQSGARNKSSASLIGLSDTSYLKVVNSDGQAHMAWSRGKYVFYVVASSEAELDTFMNAFPF